MTDSTVLARRPPYCHGSFRSCHVILQAHSKEHADAIKASIGLCLVDVPSILTHEDLSPYPSFSLVGGWYVRALSLVLAWNLPHGYYMVLVLVEARSCLFSALGRSLRSPCRASL